MSSTDTNQASEDELREQLADKLEWYSRYRERRLKVVEDFANVMKDYQRDED